MQFDWKLCPELAVAVTPMVSQEVCDYWLQCLPDSSASLSSLSNIGNFINFLIWGPSNIPTLSFLMLIHGNFSWRKINLLPFLSIAFTKFFITSNLIWKDENSILFSSTRWDWTLCESGLNTHFCLTQKQGYFVYPPWSPRSNHLKISTD